MSQSSNYTDARESETSPDSEGVSGSPTSDDSYQTANSGSSQSYQSVDSGSGSTGGSSTTMDVNLVSGYHMQTNTFTLKCIAQTSSQSSQRMPFTELLEYDFKKTVWYSHIGTTLFLSDSASTSQQLFMRTGECGYHLYLTNDKVLSVIYCYKDGNGFQCDIPVSINEIIPKIRVKELNTEEGMKEVLVVGRKVQFDSNGESSESLISSIDHPMPSNLNDLRSKSFGIYVENGAKLVVLDKHYSCSNIRYHNNTLVTSGGFLVIEGELFIGQPIEGINLYSVQTEEPDKPNPVYFLEKTSSQSLCWGLAANSLGIWCLLVPDNANFVVKNYESEGLWEVLQQHSSKPWTQTVEHQ